MAQNTETWHDQFAGLIPKEDYSMHLEQGERQGLRILLDGKTHQITLDFGNVQGVNIVDEGVQLNGPIITNHKQLQEANFGSTIYLVENGTYEAYIKNHLSPELYNLFTLRQYCVVTCNYVVEIVTSFSPEINIK